MRTRTGLFIVGAIVTVTALAGGGGFALASTGGGSVATPPPQTQAQQKAQATREAEAAQKNQLQAITAAAQNPATRPEAVLVPIAPCRIVDTRAGTGSNRTRFVPNTTRSYVVSGATGFPAQGGKSGGCGIPASATAIAATVIAVNPSAKGALRAWAAGSSAPTANVLNYGTVTGSSGATIGIEPGPGAALTVKNLDAKTDVVVDVTGYYEPQMHGMVGPSGNVYSGSSRIVSATNPGAGLYTVTFDRDITYCTPMVDAYNGGPGVYGAAYAFSGSTATVSTWYLSPTTHLEVPQSFYFYISVVC